MHSDTAPAHETEPYLTEIGRAVFKFASLEWTVVWCSEKAQPGAMAWAHDRTAGQIADRFLAIAKNSPPTDYRNVWIALAEDFHRLSKRRNILFHSVPETGPTGEQRLSKNWIPWTFADVVQIGKEFADCQGGLGSQVLPRLSIRPLPTS